MSTRYITQTAFTSLMGTELTYPDGRKVTSEYNALYRRTSVKETSSDTTIASWQFIGPSRSVETVLVNDIIRTALNNSRTHSAVQPNVPNPAWGNASSDRLGFDGSGRPITKRYLIGGINSSTHAYNNTTPVVGQATIYDRASNKIYEWQLHAETRSTLYDPFDIDIGSAGGYDSANRLRQYHRGTLASTNGYLNQGGGSITTPISLPDTDTARTYDLDGLGNWKHTDYTPVGGTSTQDLRQHNKLNEITRRAGFNLPSSGVIFAFDGQPGASNGNLADDGTLLYSYDALNRLIEVKRKSDSATIGEYTYDALNRRVSKTVSNGGLSGNLSNGTTVYLYNSNWQVIEERNDSDTTTKQYVWGEYIDELIQMKTAVTSGGGNLPAGNYYPLQDLLYRNTALTDSTGTIVETYDTDAYGNTLIFKAAGANSNWWADDAVQTDNPACEIIYCGYRYEPESSLYYVRNRTYNPSLGRWLQRDPAGYIDGLLLYRYVGDNPLFRVDPSGLYWLYYDLPATPSKCASVSLGMDIMSRAQGAINALLWYDYRYGGGLTTILNMSDFDSGGAARRHTEGLIRGMKSRLISEASKVSCGKTKSVAVPLPAQHGELKMSSVVMISSYTFYARAHATVGKTCDKQGCCKLLSAKVLIDYFAKDRVDFDRVGFGNSFIYVTDRLVRACGLGKPYTIVAHSYNNLINLTKKC